MAVFFNMLKNSYLKNIVKHAKFHCDENRIPLQWNSIFIVMYLKFHKHPFKNLLWFF